MKLSLNLTQRIKIQNIIWQQADLNAGQMMAASRIENVVRVKEDEAGKFEYVEEIFKSEQGDGIQKRWNHLADEEKIELEFDSLSQLHLKKFILNFSGYTFADTMWLMDLFTQLDITDDELQKFSAKDLG